MPSFGERGAEALAAYRQAREEEAERLRSLRATGVEEEHEFVKTAHKGTGPRTSGRATSHMAHPVTWDVGVWT